MVSGPRNLDGSRPLALSAALTLALVAPAGLLAQDPPAATPPETGTSAPAGGLGLHWRSFELRGRVLGRWLSETENGRSDSDWDGENARLELRWRPRRWLRAVAEYDLVEKRHLRDAYVALRPGRFEIRAGQFKPPISPIEQESRWDLPASERGLLSEVLDYSFGITGRRPGLLVSWDQKGAGWSVTAGVLRASSVRGDRIGDGSFDNLARDWDALKAMGRVEWQGRRVQLGASFDLRPAEPIPSEGYRRFWTASADFGWRTTRRRGPRLWAEGYVGSSWQDAAAFDGRAARFLAGRLLAAWRAGGRGRNELYLEPYLMGSAFDPDATVREDLLWEAAGGVHLGGFRHLRVVLEAQHRSISRNAPLSLGLFPIGEAARRSRTRWLAQLGAAF